MQPSNNQTKEENTTNSYCITETGSKKTKKQRWTCVFGCGWACVARKCVCLCARVCGSADTRASGATQIARHARQQARRQSGWLWPSQAGWLRSSQAGWRRRAAANRHAGRRAGGGQVKRAGGGQVKRTAGCLRGGTVCGSVCGTGQLTRRGGLVRVLCAGRCGRTSRWRAVSVAGRCAGASVETAGAGFFVFAGRAAWSAVTVASPIVWGWTAAAAGTSAIPARGVTAPVAAATRGGFFVFAGRAAWSAVTVARPVVWCVWLGRHVSVRRPLREPGTHANRHAGRRAGGGQVKRRDRDACGHRSQLRRRLIRSGWTAAM